MIWNAPSGKVTDKAARISSLSAWQGERAGVRDESHPRPPDGRGAGGERLAAEYSGNPSRELSIQGVEKTDETVRLCRLNFAVHGGNRFIQGTHS